MNNKFRVSMVAFVAVIMLTFTGCKGESPTAPKEVFRGTFTDDYCAMTSVTCESGTTVNVEFCVRNFTSVATSTTDGCNSQSSCDAKAAEKWKTEVVAAWQARSKVEVTCKNNPPAACVPATYTPSFNSHPFGSTGGTVNVGLTTTTANACPCTLATVTGDPSFTASVTGNVLSITAPPLSTTGASRNAVVDACGAKVNVGQNGPPTPTCPNPVYSVSPQRIDTDWQERSFTVTVSTQQGCAPCTAAPPSNEWHYAVKEIVFLGASVNMSTFKVTMATNNSSADRSGDQLLCGIRIPFTQGGKPIPPQTCTPVSINSHPTSRTITSGQSTTLSVSASGTSPINYQWYVGSAGNTSSPISGSSSITVNPTTTTSYWVRVTNSCGSADSGTATVTVTPPTSQCHYTFPPTTQTWPAAGEGEALFNVNTNPDTGCSWSLQITSYGSGPNGWFRFISGQSGNGDGVVKLFVSGNAGAFREGKITATYPGGQSVEIKVPQAGN